MTLGADQVAAVRDDLLDEPGIVRLGVHDHLGARLKVPLDAPVISAVDGDQFRSAPDKIAEGALNRRIVERRAAADQCYPVHVGSLRTNLDRALPNGVLDVLDYH